MLPVIIMLLTCLAPLGVLLVAGPGETPMTTTPKNLGLPHAEIVPLRQKTRATDLSAAAGHAAAIPSGMRNVLVDA